jgi:hypothetical protein
VPSKRPSGVARRRLSAKDAVAVALPVNAPLM